MINLLEETLDNMKRHGLSHADVSWVGSSDGEYWCTWYDFTPMAKCFNYDNGYGSQHVPSDLVIVFKNGTWMVRYEYDGAEYWIMNTVPERKPEASRMETLPLNHPVSTG